MLVYYVQRAHLSLLCNICVNGMYMMIGEWIHSVSICLPCYEQDHDFEVSYELSPNYYDMN